MVAKANLSVAPDTVELRISFNEIRDTYDLARKLSLSLYNKLKKTAVENELNEKDLKTINYSIKTKYESYQDNDKTWKERFVGYQLTHTLKLSFNIDPILLGNIVKGIDACDEAPNITINYTAKDSTLAKEQLLVKAVETSKSKANAMATAAGVKLGEVLSINYSWGEMRIYSDDLDMSRMLCEENMDFTPEDIDITDSVTVVWEIN